MSPKRTQGFSLIEVMVVVAIIGVLAALAVPSLRNWRSDQNAKTTARSIADAFNVARSEAIRTGVGHFVLIGADVGGTALTGPSGDPKVVVHTDSDGDCVRDSGEFTRDFLLENGISLGLSTAPGSAPGDGAVGDPTTGVTYTQPPPAAGNPPATWVLFQADGIPVGVTSSCAFGTLGTGTGGIYVTNGRRDYAVVVSPLGAVRILGWEEGSSAWR